MMRRTHALYFWLLALWVLSLLGLTTCGATAQNNAQAPVTLTQDAGTYTLANGLVTAVIDKRSGGLMSLRYQGREMLDAGTGHDAGYWSHEPGGRANTVDAVTISPDASGGDRAEVSVKGVSNGLPLGAGPGGSAICDIEIRYALGRGVPGIYTYTIFTHQANYPSTSIGEARFAVRLNDSIFDWLTVDAHRNKEMITAYDWDHGTRLNMKEARRMNTGLFVGHVEHKYDYSADQFDTPTYGWSSSKQHVGFWFINPSDEYLSGGPTKMELTEHRDATFTNSLTAPAAPVVLNYWRGSHYGGSECDIPQGQQWTKVVGPFLMYCDSGPTHDAMWHDAQARAALEAKRWPYGWVSGVDYPHRAERATVSGRITLHDPEFPKATMTHLLVGLAHPDYTVNGRTVDWQHDAKYYQFWTRGDAQGRFVIPNVRPGTYTLHAIAHGVLGEYAQTDVTVTPGQKLDLGRLTWTPVRYGEQLWDIGIPDRSADEFLHGNNYWHWGLYLQYPKDFPNDVHYVIGKSNFHTDWNYVEVPRSPLDNLNGTLPGTPTTWTVTFHLNSVPVGWGVLRLAICGASGIPLTVTMNDQPAGVVHLKYNATINRDSVRGDWVEKDLVFDAALMHAGTNVLQLSIPGGNVMSGVEYDYLRLELDHHAKPPVLPADVTVGVVPAGQADTAVRVPVAVPHWVTLYPNIPYDHYPATVLDVMMPKTPAVGLRPGVIMFHGGGWIESTKETMMSSFCLPYLAQGFVVCNVEYRLAKDAPAPAAVTDALDASHWFFEHAAQYGVDPKRIVVTGASAGGELALMVGMTPASAHLGPVASVAAIVDCFGPTDVADLMVPPHHKSWAVQWVGTGPDSAAVAESVSPLTYVRPGLPPFFVAQGAEDTTVPVEQSQRLIAALQANGDSVTSVFVPGAHHGFNKPQWLVVHPEIFDFLRKNGILTNPAPAPMAGLPTAGLPTLFIIGDSTVNNHEKGLLGWGDPIQAYFDPAKITVVNRARGGRSSRSFFTEGLWNQVLSQIKPGDFVLMQFGHNDGGFPGHHTKGRASLKGIGDQSVPVTNAQTGATEIVHTYGWYMRHYAEDTKAKGATPIVLSPIPRDIWGANGKVLRNSQDYGLWAKQVAQEEQVPFVDLNAIVADKYDRMGFPLVKSLYFPGDHTHTSPAGALVNAAAVVTGIEGLADCPLKHFLLPTAAAQAQAVLAADH